MNLRCTEELLHYSIYILCDTIAFYLTSDFSDLIYVSENVMQIVTVGDMPIQHQSFGAMLLFNFFIRKLIRFYAAHNRVSRNFR